MSKHMLDSLMLRSLGRLTASPFQTFIVEDKICSMRLSSSKRCDSSYHSSAISNLAVDDSEGRYLLAGALDGTLYIHDLGEVCGQSGFLETKPIVHIGRSHRHAHKRSIECVQWYPPDNGIFLSSGMDCQIKVWDANRLVPADQQKFEGKIHSHHLSSIASHSLVAVASSINHVYLWDLKSGAATHELRGHSRSVLTCQWSNRTDTLLASGGADGRVYLWDIRHARSCIQYLDYHFLRRSKRKLDPSSGVSHDGFVTSLKFSEDGLSLYSLGKDLRLRQWCTLNGHNLKAKFPLIPSYKRSGISLCGHFAFVAAATAVNILNLHDFTCVGTLEGHFNGVNTCCFNENLLELYTGGMDRNILVWDAKKREFRENVDFELATAVTVDHLSSEDED